ncbi:hypothetical protein B9S53_04915 [Arthrospira sp. O9.13F]|nr:hypothetical protein B9S53_04915 [Arthrospira sp. O9.13F]
MGGRPQFLKNSCIVNFKLLPDNIIFRDIMGVVVYFLACRHSKPLDAISLRIAKPPCSRQVFESN